MAFPTVSPSWMDAPRPVGARRRTIYPDLPWHNPWSKDCERRLWAEDFDPTARCPVCDRPYVIEEVPS